MSRYAKVFPSFVVAALLAGALLTAGCSGTRAAYDAAADETVTPETPPPVDVAKVTSEHYAATLTEINDLADSGAPESFVQRAQALEAEATPAVLALREAAEAYDAVANADNADALQQALNRAVPLVSRLVDLLNEQ